MKIDRQSRQTAKTYFRACRRPDGNVDENAVREIVTLIVEQKPRNYLALLTPILAPHRAGDGGKHGAGRKRHAAARPRRQHLRPARAPLRPRRAHLLRGKPGAAWRPSRSAAATTSGTGTLSGRLARLQQALSLNVERRT
ncbi:MAG: hypothetical protein WDO13_15610 [Verrucomicrobiota bacterium]